MTRLLLISLLLYSLVSCKSYVLEGANKVALNKQTIENNYFSDPSVDYVYKAHIEVYGNDLSGILVVKKINDSVHRIVLTTDFGNKLMDFELSENDFKVNYIISDLNKKIIISTLREDFRIMIQNKHQINDVYDIGHSIVYKSYDKNKFNYIFEEKNKSNVIEIRRTNKIKEKVSFKFTPKSTTFAESILIQHYNIKLKIELNQISN